MVGFCSTIEKIVGFCPTYTRFLLKTVLKWVFVRAVILVYRAIESVLQKSYKFFKFFSKNYCKMVKSIVE